AAGLDVGEAIAGQLFDSRVAIKRSALHVEGKNGVAGVFSNQTQLALALTQTGLGQFALSNLLSGAFVIKDLAGRVTDSMAIDRNPKFGPILAVTLRFKALHGIL